MASTTTILFFVAMIASTLVLTFIAAKRTKLTEDFYAAGGKISAFQNALALVGDFVSASSFLGFTGLIAMNGFDGLIYPLMGLMGWPLVLFLVAETLRNLGKYTFADAVAFRMNPVPVRISAAVSSMLCTLFYLLAQMVGAGYLIQLIFGIPYITAEIIVGSVMIVYVLFGGMIATTWVQMTKAVLLMIGAVILSYLVLVKANWNPLELTQKVSLIYGDEFLEPGKLYSNSWDLVSLGLAFMFGTAGLPHILMRFYTVPDRIAARKSALYATGMIGFIYLLTFFLGFGAMAYVGRDVIANFDKGGNMAALLLAQTLGGPTLLGYISAVAFATILAVVAGLTLSGAATISHDIWLGVIRKNSVKKGEEIRVAKISTIVLGLISILLGIAFQGQNVAVLVGLAFSIAASSNFPALILATYWKRATTSGVVASMVIGALSSVILIGLSPTVMVDILHCDYCVFPFKNPGLFTIPGSFVVGILVSLVTKDSKAQHTYAELLKKMAS
ncbi:solute symporter family protein [Candidatus Bodocaedibacter vickermanii]|uniref:Cation/acetate symporter ActP n=1 Tax=Candidatus Bodocaedibacter vickermanii TaxID=2741701 RepID=A0A7L9RVJ9_9PROT|nr:Cation/acetate symporter ActP [Candidatus Paracaedibacteraceae bacterium 'Lake Konstanz']